MRETRILIVALLLFPAVLLLMVLVERFPELSSSGADYFHETMARWFDTSEQSVEAPEPSSEISDQLIEDAQAGNLDAQYELGVAYASSSEGDYDLLDEKAVYWLRKAAEGGHVLAQNEIGYIYRKGRFGRKKDIPTALAWFYSAAKQGDDLAHVNLAQIFRDGDGVERDDAASTKHFKISAELEYPPAQFEFGLRLREGVGIPRNILEGRWWILKARSNDFGAQDFLFDELSSDEFEFENMAFIIAISVRVSQSGGSWAEETYVLANSISESGGIEKARGIFPPRVFRGNQIRTLQFWYRVSGGSNGC